MSLSSDPASAGAGPTTRRERSSIRIASFSRWPTAPPPGAPRSGLTCRGREIQTERGRVTLECVRPSERSFRQTPSSWPPGRTARSSWRRSGVPCRSRPAKGYHADRSQAGPRHTEPVRSLPARRTGRVLLADGRVRAVRGHAGVLGPQPEPAAGPAGAAGRGGPAVLHDHRAPGSRIRMVRSPALHAGRASRDRPGARIHGERMWPPDTPCWDSRSGRSQAA